MQRKRVVEGLTVGPDLQRWRRSLVPKVGQEEMADRLKIARSTYGSYEQNKPIPRPILEELVGMGFQPNLGLRPLTGRTPGKLKLYGPVGAGTEPMTGEVQTIDVPVEFSDPEYGGLVCEGDSMMPFLQPGDKLAFRNSRHLRRGLVFAFRAADATYPEVKEVGYSDHEWTLVPWNERYQTRPIEGDEPLGYLVGIISRDGRLTIGPEPNGLTRAHIEYELKSRLP